MYVLGSNVRMSLYGNSHGRSVGCILDGIPKNFQISEEMIKKEMDLRRPSPRIGTKREELDHVHILSGITNGITNGTPILIDIPNIDVKQGYEKYRITPRPGHADITAYSRSMAEGIFSGRLTAPIVAAGSIAKQFLSSKNIEIAGFTRSVGNVIDDKIRKRDDVLNSVDQNTRAVNKELDSRMINEIRNAASDGDSVGGVVECQVYGLPLGFGNVWFDSLESMISKAVFGIPGVKGIEFGDGFRLSYVRGSQSNDPFFVDGVSVKTRTNKMGGILGGMSTGMPLVFRAAFKPTPSISKQQDTVDLVSMTNTVISAEGRNDPCIVPRAVSVIESITALMIVDMMVAQ